ncbi:glycosyltransferase involved in cell wall biosynthesis [Kitasatospora sp. SolWspMP-SS2h]|uniref:glycosyltransferase family 4 protein n=1 Tax=Kitasatospora sp. SolWspMP-SS2h TaxID=1305729 RepID=UPI000DB956B4|nr:glycosyltransferase family 4 protein [Kitasatospora sp. SolWspMP-SS2h]RAJ30598.1 glycosyltransferase involved in cell wall biosynthesis [Kitasatospora sp. SolWspMP-SS2h]
MDPSAARAAAAHQLHVVLVLAAATGGIGAHVRSLTRGLVAHGVTVTVCAPEGTDRLFGFSRAGARLHTVDITPTSGARSDATAIGELRRAFTGAGIVHAHGLRAGLLSDLALRTAGRFPGLRPETPLVVTSHHALLTTGLDRRLQRLMERRVVRAADLVLGASSDLVARARELGATDARLGPVAAPPMPPGTLDRDDARKALPGGDDGRPVVLAIGRLVPQKCFGLLLDAAGHFAAPGAPAPRVLLAGDGPERQDLRERIAAEQLPVELLGYRTDIPDLLAAADLVVLSSRWEARSLVAQEAMRAGVPVVATAVGGVPELVGDAAVLVPFADPRALGAAVRDLLADPGRRAALCAAGRAQAATWPDEAATVAQVLSIYDELAQRRP